VTEELAKNPARKFIYVEQAFFQMWWERQTPAVQTQFKTFVANGQFEFINGSVRQRWKFDAAMPGCAHLRFPLSVVVVVGACMTRPTRIGWTWSTKPHWAISSF
jgi:hypothetical protein